VTREPDPRLEVRVESWADHRPSAKYDAIFAIESIEHFARPGLSRAEKIHGYRALFECCHAWLRPGGSISVQMSAYGNSFPGDFDSFLSSQIFPETDPPLLSEVMEASERLFEIVSLRNDRIHYAKTLRDWLKRLNARRSEAIALVGSELVTRFDRYLRLCVYAYESGASDLHRMVFRRIDRPRLTSNQEPSFA
jgi:cyclopropane-fatty-acyl-phospholipid synthase